MKYGIRFVYIGGNQNTEVFYETEQERNDMFRLIQDGDWREVCNCGRTVVNLVNVIYAEQIER